MKKTILMTLCLLVFVAGGLTASAQRQRNQGPTDPTVTDPTLVDPTQGQPNGRQRTRGQFNAGQYNAGQYDPTQFNQRRGGTTGRGGIVYYGAPRFGTNEFDVIDANNIFDPNRVPPRRPITNAPVIPRYNFTLTGVMSYGTTVGDKAYAFFYGSAVSSTQGYSVSNNISGYTITEISNNVVKMTDTNNQVYSLKVGSGFSKVGTNDWKFFSVPEPVALASSSDSLGTVADPGDVPAGPMADVMARLQAKRLAEEQGTTPGAAPVGAPPASDAPSASDTPATDSTPTPPPAPTPPAN